MNYNRKKKKERGERAAVHTMGHLVHVKYMEAPKLNNFIYNNKLFKLGRATVHLPRFRQP